MFASLFGAKPKEPEKPKVDVNQAIMKADD